MSTKHSYAQLKKDILFEQEQIEKTVAKIKKFKRVKDEAIEQAGKILFKNMDAFYRLSQALFDRNELSGDEALAMLEGSE